MTYHDAQGNEIEDLEMDEMRVQRCWLCGSTAIYESGLCQKDYAWAEDNTEPDASEQEIRDAYDDEMEDRVAQADWELGPGYSDGEEPTQEEWEQYQADEGPYGRNE